MKQLIQYLHKVLAYSFLGAVAMTAIAPSVSRLLISPPVSFGVNCEPAANWSMMALIRAQAFGLAVGALLAVIGSLYSWRKHRGPAVKGSAAAVENAG